MSARLALLATLLGMIALSWGCTVGPDYETPEYVVPDLWHADAVEGLSTGTANLQTWWVALGDPLLEDLIRRAETNNLELRASVARLQESRALLGVAAGERLPAIDASGVAQRIDLSENTSFGLAVPEDALSPNNLFDVGFDASWEIDVFGRIRRSIEAAGAAYQASIEDYRDVLVTLFAEVARNYTLIRELQLRIAYAEANVESQRSSFRLARDRYQEGATSALDVAQAESNVRTTEAAIPALEIALNATRNRLAVLLGEPPGSLDEELAAPASIPLPPESLTVGIPADLMRQRPDVRRRERLLASQTARIGVATADLYPRFSLSGFFAVQAADLDNLFSSGSQTWGISLPFRWRLFDGGRIRSFIDVEEARTEQALVNYERSVLFALEEVENALIGYSLERNRQDRLAAAAAASQRAVELAKIQYREGLTDFQNVLDMERFLFSQQDQLAESEGLVVQNLIALYKALGGGWSPDAQAPTDAPGSVGEAPPEE